MFILPPVQKYNIGGRWLQRKIIDILPWKLGHQLRDIVDMMHETSSNVFESKRKAMSEEGDSSGEDQKKDILGILSQLSLPIASCPCPTLPLCSEGKFEVF
jgi:hypothetical protein